MSDSKQKIKVKREHDDYYDPSKNKPIKSPKDSRLNDALKAKKEVLPVKKEHETPVKKPVQIKKDSETPVKTVNVKKEVEGIKTVKSEPHAVKKQKASDVISKVKTVKKEELTLSSSKTASSNSPSKKKKVSKDDVEKKEKKVYDLPGQKHDPPDERDPLRIFYESLYEQNPKSEMAEIWMMEHGLLKLDAAKKAFERKKKNQLSQKMGSPVKPSKNVVVKSEKTSSKIVTVKSEKKSSTSNGDNKSHSKVKRKLESDDDDDDFIVKPKKKLKPNAQ